jgi:putative salt-induced outer membrane protein
VPTPRYAINRFLAAKVLLAYARIDFSTTETMSRWILLLFALVPAILHAAETAAEQPPNTWQGEGELGFSSTSGNTESENLNASLGLSRQAENWKHSISLEAFRAKTDGETTVDLVELRERSEYGLSERSYAYGQLRYQDDEFSGYDYQATVTVGAGSRLLEGEKHRLDASAGVGVRRVKDSASGDSDDEGIVGADLLYEYIISETASLSERLLVEAGDDNTYSESETALATRINGALSAKISYLVKHNSEVPPGIEKTDRFVTVSLVYGF